jgi:hypothetical protein
LEESLFPEELEGAEEEFEEDEDGGVPGCCCAKTEQLNPSKPANNQLRISLF